MLFWQRGWGRRNRRIPSTGRSHSTSPISTTNVEEANGNETTRSVQRDPEEESRIRDASGPDFHRELAEDHGAPGSDRQIPVRRRGAERQGFGHRQGTEGDAGSARRLR